MSLMTYNPHVFNHVIAVLLLFATILWVEFVSGGLPFTKSPGDGVDPWNEYGIWFTILLYVFKFTSIFSLPLGIFNILGIIMFNTSPKEPKLMSSLFLSPFICFRVVTRGLYPDLVKEKISKNIDICEKIGLSNYHFEVVTDNEIGFSENKYRLQEIVVPKDYIPPNKSLFKARALHYCWQPGVSIVGECDWVVHLDEETELTESSVIGIVNFVSDGQYDFGQGTITYAKISVVNWITTLCDSVRSGLDYGVLQFTLGYLHCPVYSWKGSFIVARASAENHVGFDFGPEGSVAEDCFFALKAWSLGYTFNIVRGEMKEMSPFSILDLIKQRARWLHGICLTALNGNIPGRFKIGVIFMMCAWITLPFQVANIYFLTAYPLPLYKLIHFILNLPSGALMFMFFFGADKSFYQRNRKWPNRLLINILSVVNMALFAGIFELIALLWQLGIWRFRTQFYIVAKDLRRPQQMV